MHVRSFISDLVANKYKPMIRSIKVSADAERGNKKIIKDILTAHLKTAGDDRISSVHYKAVLQAALPHIEHDVWERDVYGAYFRQLIDDHNNKLHNKSIKLLQSSIDKGIKKQTRDLVVKYTKAVEIPKVTKSLCKAYMIAELHDNC